MKENDMTENLDYKRLAKELAIEVVKRTASYAMSSTDVALFLGYEPESGSIRRVLEDPTFPQPVALTENGRRRWARPQVEAWTKAKFDEQGALILRRLY